MDALDTMSYLYPVLTIASLALAVLLLWVWFSVLAWRLFLALATFFACEFVVLLLLTMLTGRDPAWDINAYRPWVVWARSLMFLALVWVGVEAALLIKTHGVGTKIRRLA